MQYFSGLLVLLGSRSLDLFFLSISTLCFTSFWFCSSSQFESLPRYLLRSCLCALFLLPVPPLLPLLFSTALSSDSLTLSFLDHHVCMQGGGGHARLRRLNAGTCLAITSTVCLNAQGSWSESSHKSAEGLEVANALRWPNTHVFWQSREVPALIG